MSIEREFIVLGKKIPFTTKRMNVGKRISIPESGIVKYESPAAVIVTNLRLTHTFIVQDNETIVFFQDPRTSDIPRSFRANYHPGPVFFRGDEINQLGPFPTRVPLITVVLTYKKES